jgi:hypothetical protein
MTRAATKKLLIFLYFIQLLIFLKQSWAFFHNCFFSLMTSMDGLVLKEAEKHGMCVREVDGTRTTISNLEGVIFDITLK